MLPGLRWDVYRGRLLGAAVVAMFIALFFRILFL
jgi:hypothetical protein